MLQDILPMHFKNEYQLSKPNENDYLLVFHKSNIIMKKVEEEYVIPMVKELPLHKHYVYLFSIDEKQFFLGVGQEDVEAPLESISIHTVREKSCQWVCFAVATAYHLSVWYEGHQFCGKCGAKLMIGEKERTMVCKDCGQLVYPVIAPAVIVGVIDHDRILFTKYNGRVYKKYALVAGFCEIGETAEETVRREVMEEVGLKVKNIRYYKSQPWGFASNLLLGYFAELDGEDTIKMDQEELSVAEWKTRDELKELEPDISLTREMMVAFKEGKV